MTPYYPCVKEQLYPVMYIPPCLRSRIWHPHRHHYVRCVRCDVSFQLVGWQPMQFLPLALRSGQLTNTNMLHDVNQLTSNEWTSAVICRDMLRACSRYTSNISAPRVHTCIILPHGCYGSPPGRSCRYFETIVAFPQDRMLQVLPIDPKTL